MPRGRKPSGSVQELLDQQIEKDQAKVIRTKKAYDAAVKELQEHLDKRDAYRKDELWKAVIKGGRSYDDILKYAKNEGSEDNE